MVPPNATVILDVGCSNGALGASLGAALPGRQVVGIESNPALAAEASTRLDSVVQADLNSFEWDQAFAGRQFDCIIFADVLEHLLDPHSHLVQARRCLRPGGCFVISLPNIRHVSALYSIFVCGTFPRRDRGIFDSTHLHWFTLHDAKQLIADASMKVEQISGSLRVRDRGDGFLNKLVRKLLDPFQGFSPVREFLTYQFCIKVVMCEKSAD